MSFKVESYNDPSSLHEFVVRYAGPYKEKEMKRFRRACLEWKTAQLGQAKQGFAMHSEVGLWIRFLSDADRTSFLLGLD